MSRVALVFPYFRTRAATEMLFPPLGIATLAAHLRRAGVETRVFDCTFSSFAQLESALSAFRPDIVGISSIVSLTHNSRRVSEMVRARFPGCLIVAGGPLPTVFPGRYSGHVDAVFRGEADLSFPRFVLDYFDRTKSPADLGALPLASYDGLFVGDHGLSVDNATVHHPESMLATFPPPDRGDFDHAAYQGVWLAQTGSRVTSIITSLGCPYNCDFCSRPVFGAAVRRRSLDAVFTEVDQIQALGYDGLWIADDLFTLDPEYLRGFCDRIRGRQIVWSCLSRANGIDAQTACLMKESGCRRVYLGLESGSQTTLDLMNKQLTVEQGVDTVELYRTAGIEVAAFFIVGYPGETPASIEETFAFALKLPLDEISFNVPLPLPGSRLFERVGWPDADKDWTHENEVRFVYPAGIDEDWLRLRIDETMAAFARRRGHIPT
jgi:anaerobic magnesium-protoporphyrin IX monomethyl ester cyclase